MLPKAIDELTSAPNTSEHSAQLDALYEIAGILAKTSGQEEMLRDILEILEKRLSMFNGVVMLTSHDDQELIMEAHREHKDVTPKRTTYKRGEGIIGQVLEHGEPRLIPRLSEEPRFKGHIFGHEARDTRNTSFICVPIILGNETVGTLSVDMISQGMKQLHDAERLLSIVASIIAHDTYNRRMARLEREILEKENQRLRDELKVQFRPESMVGNSAVIREVFSRIHQVSAVTTTCLIRGESGTGKELVASAIHYNSPRAAKPFVKVNCAALSENLLESELFGHEKGAFTGANFRRLGRIEEANGGTLFLDEIGDFSPTVQVKLLRVLQEKQFERVGSNKTLDADVRIITATNRNLEEAVAKGSFRQDLYYRINVFPIYLPPLRDRKNDILLLANHFTKKYGNLMGKTIQRISTPAINMLLAYHWPGNVRELENCIEHAVLLSQDGVIHGHELPPTLQMPDTSKSGPAGSLKQRVSVLEKELIVEALKQTKGNINIASKQLGITSRMVRYKIQNLGIDYNALFHKKKLKDTKKK